LETNPKSRKYLSATTPNKARLLAVLSIIGPIIFVMLTSVAMLLKRDADFAGRTISQLATGDYGWLETIAFVSVALTLLAFTMTLKKNHSPNPHLYKGLMMLNVVAICFVLMAAIPTEASHAIWTTKRVIHVIISSVAAILFPLVCFFMSKAFSLDSRWKHLSGYTLISGLLCVTAGGGILFMIIWWPMSGIQEYLLFLDALIWIEVIAIRSFKLAGTISSDANSH